MDKKPLWLIIISSLPLLLVLAFVSMAAIVDGGGGAVGLVLFTFGSIAIAYGWLAFCTAATFHYLFKAPYWFSLVACGGISAYGIHFFLNIFIFN